MRTRRLLAAVCTLALAAAVPLLAGGPAHAGGSQVACHGSVGCAGQSPVTSGCTGSQALVEDRAVPGVGDIDLYESSVCGTAWAVLNPTSYSPPGNGSSWAQLAEIFYEPPQGGPEQFEASAWDKVANSNVLTLMVPISGSVKACGGSPDGSNDPFDEDPQGNSGVAQPVPSGPDYWGTGACTLWH